MLRKGSLVTLVPARVQHRSHLHALALQGKTFKVDKVTGTKGKYRVHIAGVHLPLPYFAAIPQKKGKDVALRTYDDVVEAGAETVDASTDGIG
jgi:hypothetical protein